MTHLRKQMLDELQRRNYAQNTVRAYIHAAEDFAKYFHRSPQGLATLREQATARGRGGAGARQESLRLATEKTRPIIEPKVSAESLIDSAKTAS